PAVSASGCAEDSATFFSARPASSLSAFACFASALSSSPCLPASAPAAPVSTSSSGSPSRTRSPILTRTPVTLPPCGAGTSTVALSDSSTTIVSSAAITSPTLTLISITSTGSVLPTSGTLIVSVATYHHSLHPTL